MAFSFFFFGVLATCKLEDSLMNIDSAELELPNQGHGMDEIHQIPITSFLASIFFDEHMHQLQLNYILQLCDVLFFPMGRGDRS